MTYTVDFDTVSTVGLESSPVAVALAGLRANEARYFKNKYGHVFTVEAASNAQATIDLVHRILKEERDIVISSRPLEATACRACLAVQVREAEVEAGWDHSRFVLRAQERILT
jgi:hypothetical protein